ncbi:MAG: ABC transporter ATP-binding protein [Gammaproteobacteria bacterium]
MAEKILIEIRDAVKSYAPPLRALDGVSLAVRENEFFTLLGPSGCGKTTLLGIIAGFEFPDSGAVLLDGADITGAPPEKRPVNTVFQNYALFPHMTVLQNVAFGLEMRGATRQAAEMEAQKTLELVMLDGFGARRPAQLSGGQQQRVALARALANRPRVLLLDEPLSALDFKLRKAMRAELKRLQRETGVTFVFVTHDQEEALAMSDRVAVMSGGRVRQTGAPEEIYEYPADRFVADFIGEANLLVGEAAPHAGGAIVRLKNGAALTVPESGELRGAVTLAIRPERVVLETPAAEEKENRIAGEIADVVYQGNTTRYHVRLDGGETAAALEFSARGATARFARGSRVSVFLDGGALRALKPCGD